ncbi:hypothetical protein [Marinobacter sp. 2_MG-2023]|uniref:hypothetical protein n=1 Tax=Marinobacter sp. 2_MG-2023 TaxID=3062679 RepID=UPI0026E32710|nr:hypothetical protein [Marinobacter sp. 2_MG-2023]MDO6441709.1 hypothetical protein [Marinobacter sp. 2_MG-2023]
MEFIKRNWVGILGLLVGVLGIFLSYYFYTLSQQSREPYFIEESNFPIFFSQKELVSQGFVLVRKSDGREISKKVYVNEIAFWNKGSLSIRRSNILKDISLKYPENVEVIDAFVSSVTRKDIVNTDKPKIKEGSEVLLGFGILEKNDGFKVQITYLGDEKSSPRIVGNIEGVNNFGDREILTKENLFFGVGKVAIYIFGFLAIMFIFAFLTEGMQWFKKKFISGRFEKFSKVLGYIIPVTLSLIIILVFGIIAIEKAKSFAEEEGKASVPVMESTLNNAIQPTAKAAAD